MKHWQSAWLRCLIHTNLSQIQKYRWSCVTLTEHTLYTAGQQRLIGLDSELTDQPCRVLSTNWPRQTVSACRPFVVISVTKAAPSNKVKHHIRAFDLKTVTVPLMKSVAKTLIIRMSSIKPCLNLATGFLVSSARPLRDRAAYLHTSAEDSFTLPGKDRSLQVLLIPEKLARRHGIFCRNTVHAHDNHLKKTSLLAICKTSHFRRLKYRWIVGKN